MERRGIAAKRRVGQEMASPLYHHHAAFAFIGDWTKTKEGNPERWLNGGFRELER